MSLSIIQPERYSGFQPRIGGVIQSVPSRDCIIVTEMSVGGDNPKELIRIFKYGEAKRRFPQKWPLYIAKTGIRSYPVESITEYLLSRLGKVFGLEMAQVGLCYIGGQIRFLSKFFLSRNQTLVHGAEIIANFWKTDTEVLNQMDRKKLIRQHVNPGVVCDALKSYFGEVGESIFEQYILMLLFDGLVGNNDRHLFNWAIVIDQKGAEAPRFSPVYDTARGLFWNFNEAQVINMLSGKSPQKLDKYIRLASPKISWEGEESINHFRLIELIAGNQTGISSENLKNRFSVGVIRQMEGLINQEMSGILSKSRIDLLILCLNKRYSEISTRISL